MHHAVAGLDQNDLVEVSPLQTLTPVLARLKGLGVHGPWG
jgi:hypothetical protein